MLHVASQQDMIVAIQKNEVENVLRIANMNDEKYCICTYSTDRLQVD